VNGENETKWVVLKNLQFIVQRYPQIFTDIKCFLIRYNDPSYIKYEKLKILIKLANSTNYEMVLNELAEYAYDIDTEFSTKSTQMVWHLGLKITASLDKVMSVFGTIMKDLCGNGGGEHFVNEIAIGVQQIIRRYPKSRDFLPFVKQLVEKEEEIREPDSKVSLLWLISEYTDQIDGAEGVVARYIENFVNEELPVQLQILTSACKMYLINQEKFQAQIISLLEKTSESTDKADLRDRAFIYWRILTEDIGLAKEIILGARPASNPVDEYSFDEDLIPVLISDIGFLNSIFYCTVDSLPLHKIKQQVYVDSPSKGVTSNSIRASNAGDKGDSSIQSKDKSPPKADVSPDKGAKKVAPKSDNKDLDVFEMADPVTVKPTKKSLGKPPNKEQSMASKEVDIFGDDDIMVGGQV
jgi:AP-1 complex subunit beta-1